MNVVNVNRTFQGNDAFPLTVVGEEVVGEEFVVEKVMGEEVVGEGDGNSVGFREWQPCGRRGGQRGRGHGRGRRGRWCRSRNTVFLGHLVHLIFIKLSIAVELNVYSRSASNTDWNGPRFLCPPL